MGMDYEARQRPDPKDRGVNTLTAAPADTQVPAQEAVPAEAEETSAPPESVQSDADTVARFKIGDEEVTADQIQEWRKSGLRQADYTRKAQELSEQRRQIEAWYSQAKTEYEAAVSRAKPQAQNPSENQDPYLAQISETKQEIVRLKQEYEKERTDRAVDLGLNSLSVAHLKEAKTELTPEQQDEILAIAMENGAYKATGKAVDFTPAYEIWQYRQLKSKQITQVTQAKADGVKEGVKRQAERNQAVTASGRTVGGIPQSTETPGQSRLRAAIKARKTGGMDYSFGG